MAEFSTVLESVKKRFQEHKPVDRYAQLDRFRFKAEKDNFSLMPFSDSNLPENAPLALREHALQQLCTRIGVPYAFFKKCPSALQEFNVLWFMQHLNSEKDVMLRIVKENEVRAIVSDRYAPFDDIELFRMLADFMEGTEEVVFQSFEEKSTHVRITWPAKAEEIQPGDVVEQGIHIANSEVGMRSVTILGVVYRLKCKNGLIARENRGGFRHIGDPERIKGAVRQVIEDVKNDSGKLLERFKKSLQKKIEQPVEALNQLAERNNLTKEEYKALLESFMAEPSKNLFGVVNAVSNSAQKMPDMDRRVEMEFMASNLLDTGLNA